MRSHSSGYDLSNIDGPDFICIGLPKAGTGWLFDQLEDHPGFWMPPVKELLYLKLNPSKMGFVKPSGEPRFKGFGDRRVHRENLDTRDDAFLKFAATCVGEQRDMERYARLFATKGELLSGDVSPPYWNLDDDIIEEFAARFPKTKIILLVRDPVARAWSRISMAYRDDLFDPALLNDRNKFERYVKSNKKIDGVRATEVMNRWRRLARQNPFKWFLFDDIAERPEKARSDILTYLDSDPEKKGATVAATHNRKADEVKLTMNDTAQSVLAEYFADELKAGVPVFGDVAAGWLAKYGL
jgi:Sulfotransferase family